MPDIADEVGAAPVTVGRALRRHGIEGRSGEIRRIDVDEAWLRRAYAVERLRVAEIACRAGVSVNTINRRRVEFGIAKRPSTVRPDGSTMAQIGREAGASTTTVYRASRFHGVARA